MLTYYSKGQKAEFVMTEQSAVRVESSGVSGNIFIKPLIGKERIISLNFAPFYTQLDDFDAGTIVFLSVDSGFGRVGLEVSGNNTVQIVNNQSLLSFKFGNRLNPPIVPAGEDGVLFVDQNGILCTVDKLGNVFEIGASRLAPSALAAISNIVIFEKSYEMMTADERTASAAGGGYAAFAVSRNFGVTDSLTYEVWSSATANGTYTRDATDVLYAPSALLQGTINHDHRTLSITDEIDIPINISPNTLSVIADSKGQKELSLLSGVSVVSIGNETAKILPLVGVATHYSVPIRVDKEESARIYILSIYGQDPTLRPIGTRFYKVTPKDLTGNIKALADIAPISFTTVGYRNMPNPPREVKAVDDPSNNKGLDEFNYYPFFLDNRQPSFTFAHSSKDDAVPSSFFKGSGTVVTGLSTKVAVQPLQGSTTPVRIITIDPTTRKGKYFEGEKRADGERLITQYSVYNEVAGVKSLPVLLEFVQALQEPDTVETIGLSQVASTAKALVTLGAGVTAGSGNGAERNIYLIQLSGTAVPNVNLANITVSAGVGAELLGLSTDDGTSFYVQAGRSLASFELTIPFTLVAGQTLIVKAGHEADLRTSNTLTIA